MRVYGSFRLFLFPVNTIALTKPEKARMIESMLCQMAQRGQISGKLDEDQFKSLLERVSEQTQKSTTVKVRNKSNKHKTLIHGGLMFAGRGAGGGGHQALT